MQSLIEVSQKPSSGLIPLWSSCIYVKAVLRIFKAFSRHKPSGWLHPQRGTRCPWLCCLFHLGKGCWGRERTENSRKSSSQVSPGSAPPPAPPHGCSPLALVAKPVLHEHMKPILLERNICQKVSASSHAYNSTITGRMMHHRNTFPLRTPGERPRAFCSHLGPVLFRLPDFLTSSSSSSKGMIRTECSSALTQTSVHKVPLIIPHYTRVTTQGPESRKKGNRVLM